MGSLGFWEMIALAALALFIFGPERLPDMARTLGQTVNKIRREATKTLDELRDAAGVDEDLASLAREAKGLRDSITDVKSSARNAVLGPLGDVRDEVKGEVSSLKSLSAGGPKDVAVATKGLVPGDAPFDPDAT